MGNPDTLILAFEEASRRIGEVFLKKQSEVDKIAAAAVEVGRSFAANHEKEFQQKSERVTSHLRSGMRRTHADPV